jgi:hypothetical protein
LIGSIPFIDATAGRTCPAGVARIDEQDRHAEHSRLVGDEGPKLAEGPIVQSCALGGPCGLNPVPDTLEIFKGDRAAGAFGLRHECFADAVVGMRLKPALPAGHSLELAFGGLGAATLKPAPASAQLDTDGFNCLAGIGLAVAVGGDVDDAEIDAENVGRLDQVGIVEVADDGEIPVAAHEHQIHLAPAVGEQPPLMVAADIGDLLPPAERPDRQLIVGQEPEDTVIERLGAVRPELAPGIGVDLVGVSHFGETSDRDLSRQAETVAKVAINQLLKGEVTEYLPLKSNLGQPVARLVASLKRLLKQDGLLWRRQQFDVRNELHAFKYRENYVMLQEPAAVGGIAFPPPPEGGGIQARFQ